MLKRAKIILKGKVQGVNLRNFVRQEADKRGITGYVKNLPDGTVEVVGEGEDDKLSTFIRECKRGPLLAFVKTADVAEEKPTGEFEGFSIMF